MGVRKSPDGGQGQSQPYVSVSELKTRGISARRNQHILKNLYFRCISKRERILIHNGFSHLKGNWLKSEKWELKRTQRDGTEIFFIMLKHQKYFYFLL